MQNEVPATMQQTVSTKSGNNLLIQAFLREQEMEVSVHSPSKAPCLLHWGLRRPSQQEWELPPANLWPKGTNPSGKNAVQTPFDRHNDDSQVVIRLPISGDYTSIDFVLFYPERGYWDNNDHRNYCIVLPKPQKSHALLAKVFRDHIGPQKVLFERALEVEMEGQLAMAVTKAEERYQAFLLCDVPGPLLFHWGVSRYSSYDWFLPPESFRPPGTVLSQNTAQTPFQARADGLNELRLAFNESEAPLGLQFVLKQSETGHWLKDRGGNFFLPISIGYEKVAGLKAPELTGVVEQLVKAEMGLNSWTLMHRFNLCHDLLERLGHDLDSLAILFVWLRFSAIRQLTWQRNYNTKPRELSHAQDRLTHKLANLFHVEPAHRPLLRLMLGTVGRGGEGQRIRDEILNIMHRHHIKEAAGHFMEEWHQKLHNNTTPDDVVICEAYLEFLRHDGDRGAFYQTLQAGGVNKARLESFERPIRSEPGFIPHLKDGLLHDFQSFLTVLKSVHSGTDLETAMQTARGQLDGDTQGGLNYLWQHRNDPPASLVPLVERATEARRRLQTRLNTESNIRELLYLDLALEQLVRMLVERNIHLRPSGDQLVDLIAVVLENLSFSTRDPEIQLCLSHWERLKKLPRFNREWSLHAKAALDRIGRALGGLMDRIHALLQPKAQFLGNAFHADAWTISLFSEEVVRGTGVGFVLSMLVHHLDPVLRQAAQLGNWQIISRGQGQGRVEVVDSLRTIQGKVFNQPRVVVTDQVAGDEEIPEAVTAVISPMVTDIVSHVAVRARNAQLLFAACYDNSLFQHIKSLQGQDVRVEVNASGDVVIAQPAEEAKAKAPRARTARLAVVRPQFTTYAAHNRNLNAQIAGGKSLNLDRLRGQIPDWMHIPESVVLPYGVFEKVLAWPANRAIAEQCEALQRQITSEPAKRLQELRTTVLELAAPKELVTSLREQMEMAQLKWPEDWDTAWTCIKRVWASKWNERAYLSRQAMGIAHDDLVMAVLIQPLVEATYAFVIHTVNPLTGNPKELFAEMVLGLGETLVGNYPGRALSFMCDKSSVKSTLLAYPSKSTALYGGGLIFRSDSNGEDLAGYAGAGLYDSVPLKPPATVPIDYSQEPLVWDESFRQNLFGKIASMGMEIERVYGSPQDIEGAVAGNQYFVVQSRPQAGAA